MKLNKGAYALWFFTLLLLCVGIAGIIASLVGNSWWVSDNNKEGLLNCQVNQDCDHRKNILQFNEDKDKDAILLVLIVSAVASIAAIINLILLLCCRKNEENWKCGALILTLFSFSGAIAGLGAFIYSEVEFKEYWNDNDHGWSVIFGWVGACCLAIAFVLSFALICNGPNNDDYNRDFTHSNTNTYNNGRSNRGYEMQ